MFIIATTICTGSESQTDIKAHFSLVPIHYKLNLIPNIKKSEFDDVTINKHEIVSFNGESRIIINILHPISFIRLQKKYPRRISAKMITKNGIIYEMESYTYFHGKKEHILRIYFRDILLPGFYTVKMEFIGTTHTTHFNVERFFKNSHINKDEVIQ